MGRWFVFGYCVLVLGLLVALALWYLDDKLGFLIPEAVPDAAVAAAWAGALGGIAISFRGVFSHPRSPSGKYKGKDPWSNEWIPWHLGRPFTGLIVGVFVFVALKAVYPSGDPSEATLAAAAFVLGTQESAFFQFVTKIGAVVVSSDPPRSPGAEVKKPAADPPKRAGGP